MRSENGRLSHASTRRSFLRGSSAALAMAAWPLPLNARDVPQDGASTATRILRTWYGIVLNLIRHTPTYSPPVASRSLAYLGIAAHEALAGGNAGLVSLAGQITHFAPPPRRLPGAEYSEAVILHSALSAGVRALFGNTGPTGQRVVRAADEKLLGQASAGIDEAVVARSREFGEAITAHILDWSRDDGGAVIENMGFPLEYALKPGPANWVPTSRIAQQQLPLLPRWGENRPFAMPTGNACPLPPPPAYSEEEGSEFHDEAMEVYETVRNLTPEQEAIARFWSDDPMLSPTPPGHWLAIALAIAEEDGLEAERLAPMLAVLGIGMADAFIGCWYSKFEFDLLRPVTYINRVIDPAWEPVLITPPFPEYPSGHSTLSGASSRVLAHFLGSNRPFTDATHVRDGLPARDFANFDEAAEEAAMSRLYGGIHFRAAIDRGVEQGRCIAAYATALRVFEEG